MFAAKQIKDMMTAQPFKPFRICMTDGKTFDITNHDGAFVLSQSIEVAMEPDAEGFDQRVARCAILNITRIEELQAA